MSFLDSIFASEKTLSASFENVSQTVTNGVPGAKTYNLVAEMDAILWRGSMADRFISAQYRADVSAIALVRPEDFNNNGITKSAKITFTDDYGVVAGIYSLIYADDIANQGEVVALQLTEFKTK